MESPGNIISSRVEKKHYDSIELPKVIAYFEKDSKGEMLFSELSHKPKIVHTFVLV